MQGLGEYGGIAGAKSSVSSRFDDIASALEDAVRNPTPKTWIGVAIFFFILWFLFFRRRY
jgi:hypothetical protein